MLTISLEGQKKIRYEDDNKSVITKLSMNIPGINVSKKFPIARSAKDPVVLTFVMSYLRKYNVPYHMDNDAHAWLVEQRSINNEIARIKLLPDYKELNVEYADKLRCYQRVDVHLMKQIKSCILGNDPGTGKTLECIALADELDYQKVLIICPMSIMGVWEKEIKAWSTNPDAKIVPHNKSYKKKETTQQNLKQNNRFKIIHYAMLQRKTSAADYPELFNTDWDMIIVDEAHVLKNNKTAIAQNVGALKKKSLILATGTWITKNHHEVFNLLKLLDPNVFSSYWTFVNRFCVTEENYAVDNDAVRTILGPKNIDAYKYMMNRYLIQRKKEEVLAELPEVIYRKIYLGMTPTQSKLYKDMLNDLIMELNEGEYLASPNIMTQQLRLRQILASPAILGGKDDSEKTKAILDIVSGTDSQIVIFSWFKKYVRLLEKSLKALGISVCVIDGDTVASDRSKFAEGFSKGKYRIIIGTIKAMSEGLNLQTADTLIFADKSYVPADNNQAISRIHRMGQKNNALIYDLITPDTVEEVIDDMAESRTKVTNEMEALDSMIRSLAKIKK